MTKTRNEKVEVTTAFTKIKQILREYYGELYSSKLDNLDQMGNFLERQKLPKLTLEEIGNLNRPVAVKKLNS